MKQIFHHQSLDWQALDILSRDRLPPRPFYCGWDDRSGALGGKQETSPHCQSLNGSWDFRFFDSPFDLPADFMEPDGDTAGYAPLPVPSHWQLHGYGAPHYTDAIALVPTHFPPIIQSENPTGVYRKWVQLTPDPDLEYLLRFDGVESAFHLWVNGQAAGYSQGSRNTAEFDITPLIQAGQNLIAVAVYQYCDGSMIECQDMWTLAGIMRDVTLLTRPRVHLSDLTVTGDLDRRYRDGILRAELQLANHTGTPTDLTADVCLLEGDREILRVQESVTLQPGGDGQIVWNQPVPEPKQWTAETPNLYGLLITLRWDGGEHHHFLRVGFRKVELKEGLIHINGKIITFRGMNRHDWSCDTGRAITEAEMRADLVLMKRANINAVRSAHYPNQQRFYELCDEMGFYAVAEADLECNQTEFLADPNCLSDSPRWTAAYLDRVERMVRRDKNFACIVIWSLGNESGYGRNFAASAAFCRETDPTRLLIYEEDREAESVDMYASMYTKHADLERLGKRTDLQKPHILIEYAHAMGNSPGSLADYWEIIDRYPRLQGGFLWEWIAHGIRWKDAQGRETFRYGGDFGDYPNSGKFCTSGILAPDRTPYPGLWQLKKAYQPVRLAVDFAGDCCTVKNCHSFLSLDTFALHAEVVSEGETLDRFGVDINGIGPGEAREIPLAGLKHQYNSACPQVFLNLVLTLRETPAWADRGPWVVTVEQAALPAERVDCHPTRKAPAKANRVTAQRIGRFLAVNAGNTVYTFDLADGTLSGLERQGRSLLAAKLDTCFWRAPLDNDRWQLEMWKKFGVDTLKTCVRSIETSEEESAAFVLRFQKTVAPITMDWSIDITETFTVEGEGVSLQLEGCPKGRLPHTLPRAGIRFALAAGFREVAWYGRGPGPSYRDAYRGTPVGLYRATVEEMAVPYVVPQENGARLDTRWFAIGDGESALRVESARPVSFSALPYSMEQLDAATHQSQLLPQGPAFVHVDAAQHGLGSAGWGPEPLEKDWLKPADFTMDLRIRIADHNREENWYEW